MDADQNNSDDINKGRNSFFRRDFLKKSLTTGFFLNLGYYPSIATPGEDHGNIISGRKRSPVGDVETEYWHDKIRTLLFRPDGLDFVIANGEQWDRLSDLRNKFCILCAFDGSIAVNESLVIEKPFLNRTPGQLK